ncbi:MAG: hypothetical protein ACTSVT_10865 [Candidatus Thorarchaeota archaeon]
MTERDLARAEILHYVAEIVHMQVKISQSISEKLCKECGTEDPKWSDRRRTIMEHLRGLMTPYDFCQRLPQDELGIAALSIVTHLLKIQFAYAQVILMIDMIRGGSFQDVYMDSLSAIASKVHSQFVALSSLLDDLREGREPADEHGSTIMRLEREIDEDNIVICRQVSVATGGDSSFVCYMRRKIVSELEHISDDLKQIAEILADF